MAAPIAHIYLAIQMLAGPLINLFNEKEFVVGTSFPDIRYLKVIQRNQTHYKNVTLDQIKNEKDSFKAGMLFHSFVDEKRERFVYKKKIYEKVPKFDYIMHALKFAEDQILLSIFDSKQYVSFFDEIIVQEKEYKIDEKDLRYWHNFLQDYFIGNISGRSMLMRYFDYIYPNAWQITRWGFSWLYGRKMERVIKNIENNKEVRDLFLDFYQHFSKIYN